MMRLRNNRALGGGLAPMASSTARIEAIACTVVQTPQMRCVNAQASRGSRPLRMISMPRNMVDDDQAFLHLTHGVDLRFDYADGLRCV